MSFELNLAALPNRILYLEGVQLSYIKIYVHIFNLWQSHKPCYLGTPELMNRTGLSERTVFEALAYFERMGEIKRVQKGRKRYIVQPVRAIETESSSVDNSPSDSSNSVHGCEIAHARVRAGSGLGCEIAQDNNKINNKTNNKSFCNSKSGDNSQKHDWAPMKNEAAAIAQNDAIKRTAMPDELKSKISGLKLSTRR